ncbi:hypothetical protein DTO063F5_3807 [Paecilomyces variotii]|nr:hypothetical protein DTO063F5_3807 [Paecilomyces variotii]
MEREYTVDELLQLLHEADNPPPAPDSEAYVLGLDPTILMANDSGHPTFPSLSPSAFLEYDVPETTPDIESETTARRELEVRVKDLETDTVESLVSYLTDLRYWMVEVTEALDKLGEAPASATELQFRTDGLPS